MFYKMKVLKGFEVRPSIGQTFDIYQNDYAKVIDKVTGHTDFKVVGTTNIYQSIQDANVNISVSDIVNTYTETGDVPKPLDPKFYDLATRPRDLLDAHARIVDLQRQFDKREVEFRAKYDFDFGKYLASLKAIDGKLDRVAGDGFLRSYFARIVSKKKEVIKDEK